jgi:hypothetical protein
MGILFFLLYKLNSGRKGKVKNIFNSRIFLLTLFGVYNIIVNADKIYKNYGGIKK